MDEMSNEQHKIPLVVEAILNVAHIAHEIDIIELVYMARNLGNHKSKQTKIHNFQVKCTVIKKEKRKKKLTKIQQGP